MFKFSSYIIKIHIIIGDKNSYLYEPNSASVNLLIDWNFFGRWCIQIVAVPYESFDASKDYLAMKNFDYTRNKENDLSLQQNAEPSDGPPFLHVLESTKLIRTLMHIMVFNNGLILTRLQWLHLTCWSMQFEISSIEDWIVLADWLTRRSSWMAASYAPTSVNKCCSSI